MLSHMRTMSTVFHSRGLVLTWIRGSAGPAGLTSPSRESSVMGERQPAQYDSSRSSVPGTAACARWPRLHRASCPAVKAAVEPHLDLGAEARERLAPQDGRLVGRLVEGEHEPEIELAKYLQEALAGKAGRLVDSADSAQKGELPFAPTSHLPGASTSPPFFRHEAVANVAEWLLLTAPAP
jgi:hypothetical protein